jgi:hypothetical protein
MRLTTWNDYLPIGKADRESVQRLSTCHRSPVDATMSPKISTVPFIRPKIRFRLVGGATNRLRFVLNSPLRFGFFIPLKFSYFTGSRDLRSAGS